MLSLAELGAVSKAAATHIGLSMADRKAEQLISRADSKLDSKIGRLDDKIGSKIGKIDAKIAKVDAKIDKLSMRYFNPADTIAAMAGALKEEQDKQLAIKEKLEEERTKLEKKAVEAGEKEAKKYSTGLCNRKQDGFTTAVVDGVIDEMDPANIRQDGEENQELKKLKEVAQQELDTAVNSDPASDSDQQNTNAKANNSTATVANSQKEGNTTAETVRNNPKEAADVVEKSTSPVTDYLKNLTTAKPDPKNPEAGTSMFSKVTNVTFAGLGAAEQSARSMVLSDNSGLLADSSVERSINRADKNIARHMGEGDSGLATQLLAGVCNIAGNANTSEESVKKSLDTAGTMTASAEGNAKAVEQAASENKLVFRSGGNCCVNRAAKTSQQTQENVVSVLATAEAVGIDLDEVSNAKIKEPSNTDNVAVDNTKKIATVEEEEDEFEDSFDLVEFEEITAKGPVIAKILLGEERYNKCKAMYDMSKAQESSQQVA